MKIFIYKSKGDQDTDQFLSGVYKDLREFKKTNPDLVPIKSYDAEAYLELIKKQISKIKKSQRKIKLEE